MIPFGLESIVTNGCLTQKRSENHRFQWLPPTIPFNGETFRWYKKIIVANGSAIKKTFNGDSREVKKHRKNIIGNGALEKNITIPS